MSAEMKMNECSASSVFVAYLGLCVCVFLQELTGKEEGIPDTPVAIHLQIRCYQYDRHLAYIYIYIYICRQKREAHDVEESHPVPVVGPRVADDWITSPDAAGPAPDKPLHLGATWTNISKQAAEESCREVLQRSRVYDECLNFTLTDMQQYIRSCMEDIKVQSSHTRLSTVT